LQVHLESFELDPRNPPGGMFNMAINRDTDGSPALNVTWRLSGTANANLLNKYLLASAFGYPKARDLETMLGNRMMLLGDHTVGVAGLLKGIMLLLAALMVAAMGKEAGRRECANSSSRVGS
jgi:hypothetical protein